MLTTSYFANRKVLNGLAICAFPPKWYNGPVYEDLAPTPKLLMAYKNGQIDQDEYTHIYNRYLKKLNCQEIYDEIMRYGTNVSILCYEKPGDFCHRHLVAEWIENELGIAVPEFGTGLTLR